MSHSTLSKSLPRIIKAPLGRLLAVYRRLQVWSKVRSHIDGADAGSRIVLRSALRWSPITVWKGLNEWRNPVLHRDCVVDAKGIGRFRIRANADDLFHILPGHEPSVEAALRRCLKYGDTFVDAGANIGFYSILTSRLVGAEGKVIACEMVPQTAAILRSHVELNGASNVIVVEAALAEESGKALAASYPADSFGQASIVRIGLGCDTEVRTVTLRDVLKDFATVRLIKMDIEGAELMALRGFGADISKVETIIYEQWDGATDTASYLEQMGFTVEPIDGNNALASRRTEHKAEDVIPAKRQPKIP